jgi:type VII secretion-associated serine protease mycosin
MILPASILPTVLVAASLAGPAAGATAQPGPHQEEWWFSGWSLQQDVWPLTKGRGVTVALVDTGVNANLPDLSGTVVPGKDYERESARGMVDHDPGAGHGTGMASLIVAQGRSTGWVGVAPEAKILPIANAGQDADHVADSIRYAADHGADVISMSIGVRWSGNPPCPAVVQEAVAYAAARDVVLVAAAGNTGHRGNHSEFPAGCAGVVAVGAIQANGLRPWAATQRKDYVAVAAPGAQVGSVGKDGRLYHSGNGTSQATALTSGIVALLRAENPDMPAREVVQRLINTTRDVGPKGKDDQTGYGLILPNRALSANVPASAPNPVYAALDTWKATQERQQRELTQGPELGGGTSSGGSNSGSLFLMAGVAIVLLIILAVVVLAFVRRRRPATPYGPPGQFGPPGQVGPPGQFGPPRQFGAPPPAAPPGGPPYGRQPQPPPRYPGPGQPPHGGRGPG